MKNSCSTYLKIRIIAICNLQMFIELHFVGHCFTFREVEFV
jgi:hypothetical protein